MNKINSYEDLFVWQKAHKLVLSIYEMTKLFPTNEQFGLTSQLRRAAISIPANIAEGHGRNHIKEYIQFLFISCGSLNEVRYYIRLSKDLGYITENNYSLLLPDATEVDKMLNALIKSLRNKDKI